MDTDYENKDFNLPSSPGTKRTFKGTLSSRFDDREFKDITNAEIDSLFRGDGYTRGQRRKLMKAVETLRTNPERTFEFNERGGFNVTQGSRPMSGSGRNKGSREGFDLGELVGLGRNVSLLGGVLAKTPYKKEVVDNKTGDSVDVEEGGFSDEVMNLLDKEASRNDEGIVDTPKTSGKKSGGKTSTSTNTDGAFVQAPPSVEYEIPSLLDQVNTEGNSKSESSTKNYSRKANRKEQVKHDFEKFFGWLDSISSRPGGPVDGISGAAPAPIPRINDALSERINFDLARREINERF